jgi:hypothetical protein
MRSGFRVQDTSEIFALAGVLIEEQYALLPAEVKPLTILDFGSNVGSSIAYFKMAVFRGGDSRLRAVP